MKDSDSNYSDPFDSYPPHRLPRVRFQHTRDDSMPNSPLSISKYPRYLVVIYDLFIIVFLPFTIWLAIHPFFYYAGTDMVKMEIISVGLLVLAPMYCLARVFIADIHVDDDGIGWWAWGRRWKYIRWIDVTTVQLDIIPAYSGRRSTQTAYNFIITDKTYRKRWRSGMGFTDDRPNAEALINAVNRYIRQYNIPVQDKRGKLK